MSDCLGASLFRSRMLSTSLLEIKSSSRVQANQFEFASGVKSCCYGKKTVNRATGNRNEDTALK